MIRRAALVLCLLAGCASPGPAYRGVAPVEQVIDGRRYLVFARRDDAQPRVQVVRLGYARRPEHRAILPAMRQAAEAATGCRLVEGSVTGDSGVIEGRLTCP